MAQVKDRVISREEAIRLVKRMLRKKALDNIIRDALVERGLSLNEANEIIREVRENDDNDLDMYISPRIVGLGLAIITVVMLMILVFLYIIPPQ